MEHIPHMVDMAIEQSSPADMPEATNIKLTPQYPYGLSICLEDDTLKKLDMEDDCAVGDHVAFHCLAKVTSCSDRENMGKRVELQIIAMSPSDTDDKPAEAPKHKIRNPYDR